MSHTKSTVFGLFALLMLPVTAHADDADWEALFGEPETTSVGEEPVVEEPLAEEPVAGETARIVLPPLQLNQMTNEAEEAVRPNVERMIEFSEDILGGGNLNSAFRASFLLSLAQLRASLAELEYRRQWRLNGTGMAKDQVTALYRQAGDHIQAMDIQSLGVEQQLLALALKGVIQRNLGLFSEAHRTLAEIQTNFVRSDSALP